MKKNYFYVLAVILLAFPALAAEPENADEPNPDSVQAMMGPNTLWQSSLGCAEMMVWDPAIQMCSPYPMAGMPMQMVMAHGNSFGARIWESGPRGRQAWASTNMLMLDVGTTVSNRHYLNLQIMGTVEKWSLPPRGYPLLLQIGEEDQFGHPYIDGQHPHSSPIMGLTLSDTIALGDSESSDRNYLKLSISPRGQSTDGPVPFMHRLTGIVNPDAPLGHHIGQDVGHISSTVLAASLKLKDFHVEVSTFHGSEPEPEKIDLALGALDSVSVRVIEEFSDRLTGMISASRVGHPEPTVKTLMFMNRYSASVYYTKPFGDWTFYNTFIYGLITQYDHTHYLSSVGEEFLFRGNAPRFWGRIEFLQRTPEQLGTTSDRQGKWVTSFTGGYTHKVLQWDGIELGLGGSATLDVLPQEFRAAYGGNPWAGKIFVQLSGMEMLGR